MCEVWIRSSGDKRRRAKRRKGRKKERRRRNLGKSKTAFSLLLETESALTVNLPSKLGFFANEDQGVTLVLTLGPHGYNTNTLTMLSPQS